PAAPPRRPARPGRTGGRRAAGKRELGAAARGRRGAAHGLRALSRHHAARSTGPPPAVATPAVDATTGRGHGGTRAMRRTRTATPPPPPWTRMSQTTAAAPADDPGQGLEEPHRSANANSMRQLVLVRWIAVIGQLVTISLVHWGLGITLPLAPMFAVVAGLVLFNLVAM